MGEQEDPLVSVHDVLGFLPDFDNLPLSAATTLATPSGEFSVQKGDSCCRNVNNF